MDRLDIRMRHKASGREAEVSGEAPSIGAAWIKAADAAAAALCPSSSTPGYDLEVAAFRLNGEPWRELAPGWSERRAA